MFLMKRLMAPLIKHSAILPLISFAGLLPLALPSRYYISMSWARKLNPSEYYSKFVEKKVRPDGRDITQVRKTSVKFGMPRFKIAVTACRPGFFLRPELRSCQVESPARLGRGPPKSETQRLCAGSPPRLARQSRPTQPRETLVRNEY